MEQVWGITLIELCGDAALREYAVNGNPIALSLGLATYNGLAFAWINLLKKRSLAWSNCAWDGTSALATLIYSKAVLGEQMSGTETMGALMIIGGLLFLGDGSGSPPLPG